MFLKRKHGDCGLFLRFFLKAFGDG